MLLLLYFYYYLQQATGWYQTKVLILLFNTSGGIRSWLVTPISDSRSSRDVLIIE